MSFLVALILDQVFEIEPLSEHINGWGTKKHAFLPSRALLEAPSSFIQQVEWEL